MKEKITILLNKKELKQQFKDGQIDEQANKDARVGFALSLAGFFFGLLFIPGYIFSKKALNRERNNPGSLTPDSLRLAKIGRTICVVAAVAFFLAIILVVVIITSFNHLG